MLLHGDGPQLPHRFCVCHQRCGRFGREKACMRIRRVVGGGECTPKKASALGGAIPGAFAPPATLHHSCNCGARLYGLSFVRVRRCCSLRLSSFTLSVLFVRSALQVPLFRFLPSSIFTLSIEKSSVSTFSKNSLGPSEFHRLNLVPGASMFSGAPVCVSTSVNCDLHKLPKATETIPQKFSKSFLLQNETRRHAVELLICFNLHKAS